MTLNQDLSGQNYLKRQEDDIRLYYNGVADIRDKYIRKNSYYYDQVLKKLNFIIEPNKSLLHIGCQSGYILSSLAGRQKVGVDNSDRLIEIAREKYPKCEFHTRPNSDPYYGEAFDYVIVSNLGDLVDPSVTFANLKQCLNHDARIIIHTYNRAWEAILLIAQKVGWKFPQPHQNWIEKRDLENLLVLSGFEPLRDHHQILMPKFVPVLSWFFNQVVAKLPFFKSLSLVYIVVARLRPPPVDPGTLSVSVIVPCKNEVGNIEGNVRRIPEMGSHTEIIFVDDGSTDGTGDEVRRMQTECPDRDIKLLKGPGLCKAAAVWEGFDKAQGDLIFILDGDLTTMPEELPHLVRIMAEGSGEFINTTRLVYPMQNDAMRLLNLVGNKFFSILLTFIIGQRVTDPLAAVKVMWRKDWPRLKTLVGTWGIEDHWGDFDLLFSAAKLHLKIVEFPVHFVEHVSGTTKMKRRFRNGLRMLWNCTHAFFRFNRF